MERSQLTVIKELEQEEQDNLRKGSNTNGSLEYFNFGLSLCFLSLNFLANESAKKPFEMKKNVAFLLLNRLTSITRSIELLTLRGYYYEAKVMERSFWEAMGLCCYLSYNEYQAEKWFYGEIVELPKNQSTEIFAKTLDYNLAPGASKEIYGRLCAFVHSDASAVLSLASIKDCTQWNIKGITTAIPSQFNSCMIDGLSTFTMSILLVMIKVFSAELPEEHKRIITNSWNSAVVKKGQ
jgi:hypothetical protein